MEVERVPLAREQVLDEGLVELKSIIVRLDRAIIFRDHAHREVLVEVRACLSKGLEKRVGMVDVGEEGLGNEDVAPGEEESESVDVGGRRVEESKQARRLLIIAPRAQSERSEASVASRGAGYQENGHASSK